MTVRVLAASDWVEAEPLYWELTKSGAVADEARFAEVLAHPGTQVVGKWADGRLVSMATLHILPNMTYAGRGRERCHSARQPKTWARPRCDGTSAHYRAAG